MTKQEVFNELLREYEVASDKIIWEFSGSIEESEKELEAEIENWRKAYEEAE